MKDYNYVIFDAQYYLVRNWSMMNSRFCIDKVLVDDNGSPILNEDGTEITYRSANFMSDDIVKLMFYSFAKFLRECASCNRIILCFDTPPYHKTTLLEDYKGSRSHVSEDDLLSIDKITAPLEYAETQEAIRREAMKNEAKKFMIDNFPKLGMDVIYHKGYEADDLAYLISDYIREDKHKSAIVSIDSDWSYWISPSTNWIKSNNWETWTYQDMLDNHKNELPTSETIDLFKFKAYTDSIYGSHNDLQSTLGETENDHRTIIENCLRGDYCDISDVELFQKNLKSFDIYNYPEIDLVKEKIKNLGSGVNAMTIDEFELFRLLNNFKVSTSYYSNFLDSL